MRKGADGLDVDAGSDEGVEEVDGMVGKVIDSVEVEEVNVLEVNKGNGKEVEEVDSTV